MGEMEQSFQIMKHARLDKHFATLSGNFPKNFVGIRHPFIETQH